jgi:glycosyltransferase involved in cell wall biosynthesis
MVAREDIYKDHETLLQACRHIADRLPDMRLLLCGKGTDGEALRARIAHHGLQDRVIALGVRHDMATVYSAMDVHVLSSLTEGFPNVVAESALHGCLSYCTAVGEAPRMLPDPAFLLRVGDASAMAEVLLHALTLPPDQRAVLVARQRAFLEQHYAMSAVVERYKQTYLQLVPGLLGTPTPLPD